MVGVALLLLSKLFNYYLDSKVFDAPIDIKELELPVGIIGEIIVSGWHVRSVSPSNQCILYLNV